MKSTFVVRRAMLAFALSLLAVPTSAQEGTADGSQATPSANEPSETPVEDPAVEAAEALPTPASEGSDALATQPAVTGDAIPAELTPVPEVIVAPPSALPEDTDEEEPEETDRERRAREELVPAGEEAKMAPHEVLAGDVAFKPGKGVEFNSADDQFQLRIRVRVQMLYTVLKNWEGDEDPQQDFRIRRARFIFQGHAFGRNNKYKLEVDPLRDTPILDYYLDFMQNGNISPRVGQYKLPSNRERVISSGNLSLVDRSIVNSEFTLDRDQAFDLRSADFLGKGLMRYYLGLGMGNGLNNPFVQNFDMLYFARFEYLPMGMFDDYSEADFERTAPHLSLGAGYAYFDGAERQRGMIGDIYADGGSSNYHFAYADAMFKARGFSVLSEFAFRTGKRNVGPITEGPDGQPIDVVAPRNGYGWMMQPGYLIPHLPLEFVARVSLNQKRGSADSTSLENAREAVFGINWYFAQHPFKIQADVSQYWGTALLGSSFDKGVTTARIQLQASL
jgi:phosphate-selective porin OprO/OprP